MVSVPTFAVVGTRTVQRQLAARQERIDDLLGEARWLEERKRYDEVLGRAAAVLDLDSDNDARSDVSEAGGLDANGDAIIDDPLSNAGTLGSG